MALIQTNLANMGVPFSMWQLEQVPLCCMYMFYSYFISLYVRMQSLLLVLLAIALLW